MILVVFPTLWILWFQGKAALERILELSRSTRTRKLCTFLLSKWLCYTQKHCTKAVFTHMYVISSNECITLKELGGNRTLKFSVEILMQKDWRVSIGPGLRAHTMRSQKQVLESWQKKQTEALDWTLSIRHENSSERIQWLDPPKACWWISKRWNLARFGYVSIFSHCAHNWYCHNPLTLVVKASGKPFGI